MKINFFTKKKNLSLVLLLGLFSVGILIWYSVPKSDAQSGTQAFYDRIRDGVGSEVTFLNNQTATSQNIQPSVDSLSNFINYRSGVILSATSKSKLANMESATLLANTRKLELKELSDVMTTVAMEKLNTLSDSQISSMAETLRGFDSPDLSQSFKHGRNTIRYRADQPTAVTPQAFITQLTEVRNQPSSSQQIYHASLNNLILTEISKRVSVLASALPTKFGNVESEGVTPNQALLLLYSVASSDWLWDSQSNLNAKMHQMQVGITNATGTNYPSPQGYKAFGMNGYIFSSPTNILFDEQAVNSLLDKIQERTVTQ